MKLSRRSLLHLTAGAAALPAAVRIASAQAYPTRPITLVVPIGAGGATDTAARIIAEKLQEKLQQSVVVENRPGAGSVIGTGFVAKATPDGHTLLFMEPGAVLAKWLNKSVPFDVTKDFVPIAMVATSPLVLFAHPSVTFSDVPGLIAYSKANPDTLNFASAGNGTAVHLAGEKFQEMTGTHWTHVPYKGGAAALIGIVGGEVDLTLNGLLATMPHIKSGKLKALAIAGSHRSSAMPDLPTVSEAGVPGFQSGSWQGLLAPAGTPPEIVAKIHDAVVKVLNEPEMKQRLADQGAEVVANTPEEFAVFIREDTAKWAQIVKTSGIKIE